MYNKNNLLPINITAPNNIRPEFASIAFYGNRTIATDTFRLLEVSTPFSNPAEAHEPVLMHRDDIKRAKLPAKTLIFTEADLEALAGIPMNPHLQFPDVDKIMSEDTTIEYATIKINGELLGELLLAMSKLNKFKVVELKVPINAPYKAIHCYANTEETTYQADSEGNGIKVPNQTSHGLMMPLNKQ